MVESSNGQRGDARRRIIAILRASIVQLICDWEQGCFWDENFTGAIDFRLDFLLNFVLRNEEELGVDGLRNLLMEAIALFGSEISVFGGRFAHANRISTGAKGRQRYDVSKEHLEAFIGIGFKAKLIATLLGTCTRAIERRLAEYGLTMRQKYSDVEDASLDSIVRDVLMRFSNTGYMRMTGLLRARGLMLQRERRRKYNGAGPLALWHIHSNHKPISWQFVMYGGIVGYTRLVVFLKCSTNKKAETVLQSVQEAVNNYGLPSRVRSDKGMENDENIGHSSQYQSFPDEEWDGPLEDTLQVPETTTPADVEFLNYIDPLRESQDHGVDIYLEVIQLASPLDKMQELSNNNKEGSASSSKKIGKKCLACQAENPIRIQKCKECGVEFLKRSSGKVQLKKKPNETLQKRIICKRINALYEWHGTIAIVLFAKKHKNGHSFHTMSTPDGNHKLIRWHLVFHGGIDGYTRMIVFLACSNNNRAETVFTSCHGAVQQFGLPSRIRSDKGKENLDGSNDTDFAYSSNVFSRSRKNRTDVSRTRERPPSVSQASINL
eukprot:gene12583-13871_t